MNKMEQGTQKGPSTMEMASTSSNITSPLDMNCEDAILFLSSHLQKKNLDSFDVGDLTPLSNSAFLDKVSEMMLVPALTECLCIAFNPLLPDLVARWASLGEESTEAITCALGRLVHLEPKLKRYNPQPAT